MVETIRINEDLAEVLDEVPKGTSYANWILDKIQRLKAHEKNPVCWIVLTRNVGPNTMSNGDENGISPIFEEVIEIVDKIPRTNLGKEELEQGWLGQTNDYSSYAYGGFASVEAAKEYIEAVMGGRVIEERDIDEISSNATNELYTTAEFDTYYFAQEWFEAIIDDLDLKNKSDKEIKKIAQENCREAKENGIGIVDDLEEYLKQVREELNY